MKKLIPLTFLLLVAFTSNAQKYLTREGFIKFHGSTPLENIDATTQQASSVIDASSNDIVFQVLLNSFTFEKALMQEHFNENYVESEKYPKVIFKGKITGDVNFKEKGTYEVKITGVMTLHGVDKNISVPATIIVEKEGVKLSSEFKMAPADYDIDIPSAVENKIAKEMAVTVKCMYKLVK